MFGVAELLEQILICLDLELRSPPHRRDAILDLFRLQRVNRAFHGIINDSPALRCIMGLEQRVLDHNGRIGLLEQHVVSNNADQPPQMSISDVIHRFLPQDKISQSPGFRLEALKVLLLDKDNEQYLAKPKRTRRQNPLASKPQSQDIAATWKLIDRSQNEQFTRPLALKLEFSCYPPKPYTTQASPAGFQKFTYEARGTGALRRTPICGRVLEIDQTVHFTDTSSHRCDGGGYEVCEQVDLQYLQDRSFWRDDDGRDPGLA